MSLLFADKPQGLTTHTSLNAEDKANPLVDPNDGILELLADRAGVRLWPVHRLDRETCGTIAFARDRETAAKVHEQFETARVEKKYSFITDRSIAATHFEMTSRIEREGAVFVSTREITPNSRTLFSKIRETGRYSLWSADPKTGKPHQIRLHAQDAGIPILGDTLHGGSRFPALALVSRTLRIDDEWHESPLPKWFERLEDLEDQLLCRWLAAVDRRERWSRSLELAGVDTGKTTATRLIHTEGDPLRVELLGGVAWLSWFKDQEPSQLEWLSINKLIDACGWKHWMLQVRGDRGRNPNEAAVFMSESAPREKWSALENGISYEFRRETGLSPGLFLDQRRNRELIGKLANGKTLLNLFCYTGGFSVAAAAGGATKTVSVDVSKNFLEWAKRNFELNDIAIEGHEFRAMDSREYLAWAKKKGHAFDLVVCDPPSFSRSKSGLFKLENDFEDLFRSCLAVLAPGGTLLFACNLEAWDAADFHERARKALEASGKSARLWRAPSSDLDFELPRAKRNMKSVLATDDERVATLLPR